ncbi:unnamed protein product, partial [Pylaiella littoralis]
GIVSWTHPSSSPRTVITTPTKATAAITMRANSLTLGPQHGSRTTATAAASSSSNGGGGSGDSCGGVSRSEVLMQLGRVAAGSGVFTLAGVIGSPAPAPADNALAATKQSYFRYVPRILEAMEWYQGDLQKAVVAEDWPKVLAYFEVVNTAGADSSRPTMYQSSSSRMQRELFRPLSVWAQSMSIKGTGPKLRALLAQEELLEKSMARLEKAANGKGLKEGESQAQEAAAAWRTGRDALQEYVDVANKGMVRSLRKIDTPFSGTTQ